MMFNSFAKKFATFTGERVPLEATRSGAVPHLYAHNVLFFLTFLSIFSITFSIAVSAVFLGLAIACWLYILIRHPQWNTAPVAPVYFLAGFIALALLSAILSSDPKHSFIYFKKFWTFSLLFIIPVAFRRSEQIERLYCWVAVGSTASAAVGIFQYFFNPQISLVNRITGLSGHWMTFSGLQMLSILATMSLLLSGRARRYQWIYPAIPVQIFGLVLAQTRSAWLGLVVGLLALALMINWRWVLVFASIAAASYFVLPRNFQDRLGAAFDLSDSTTRIRLELIRTGWNIIKAHPFFGVGPEMVPQEYEKYKTISEFPRWVYQHLHNDFVQIAAEMGLLALLAWMALLLSFLVHSVRHLIGARLPEEKKFAARAAICCLVAFLVAGLFEYNFGDSEVRTLFLFILTSPFVIFREAASSTQE